MVAHPGRLALLMISLAALVACGGEEAPGGIADGSTQGSKGATPGKGGAGGTGSVGAPGDPPPSNEGFLQVGDVLDPTMAWAGYAEGSSEAGTVTLADYADPDGKKGITALLITEGQADCGPCIKEAKDIVANLPERWTPAGIKVLQLVVSDAAGNPATTAVASTWKQHAAATWAVAADPNFTFAQAGSNPSPTQVLVDPRTLTIVDRLEGYRPELPELEALAAKNK